MNELPETMIDRSGQKTFGALIAEDSKVERLLCQVQMVTHLDSLVIR